MLEIYIYVSTKAGEDPALCCWRFDPSADIFGVKKSSMFDPNADRTAENRQTLRYKMRTWRPVGREVRSICGHLRHLWTLIQRDQSWNFFEFVDHPPNHKALRHHISILYCSPPLHIGALLKWGCYRREIWSSLRITRVLAIVLEFRRVLFRSPLTPTVIFPMIITFKRRKFFYNSHITEPQKKELYKIVTAKELYCTRLNNLLNNNYLWSWDHVLCSKSCNLVLLERHYKKRGLKLRLKNAA